MEIKEVLVNLGAQGAALRRFITRIVEPFIADPAEPREFHMLEGGIQFLFGLSLNDVNRSPVRTRA